MIVLSTKLSICILNVIFTNVSSRKGAISPPCLKSLRSILLASGGLMSIILPSMVDMDVAAEPIIWFIASEMALKWISPMGSDILVPSPPIIRSAITLTSCSLSTIMLEPSSPAVYLIWINTQGFSYSVTMSSHLARETTGVVMFTFLFTRE